MYKSPNEYPQTQEFLEHAAAVYGKPFALYGKHEGLNAGAELVFDVPKRGGAFCNPADLLVVANINAVTMRGQGAHTHVEKGGKLVQVVVEDRLLEGTVKRSVDESFRPGDSIIALASLGCDALIMNTANEYDMRRARRTFYWPYYNRHLT
ncbi:MAG TPA: hypothetical protein VHB72_02075 [Candidatus Saccharimonadales bacterium]|nr:hypothetical protein [Candidatus Saccharimonadales bacterium]